MEGWTELQSSWEVVKYAVGYDRMVILYADTSKAGKVDDEVEETTKG